MNLAFWLILLFPTCLFVIGKSIFGKNVTVGQALTTIVVTGGLTLIIWSGGRASQWSATEILNGTVTSKRSYTTSCSHSYGCMCTTNSNGTQTCQTCYYHSYDQNWEVEGDIGSLLISRVDWQGLQEPKRWSEARIGEPMALEHGYSNWVRAADSSLFHASPILAAQYEGKLPAYPGNVYDYYRINRLVVDGVTIDDADLWNRDISVALQDLGPRKQANLIVVITKDPSPDYATALRAHWQGANKNDVVTVIGAPEFPAIAWARAFSWTKDETVNIEIRNRLQELGKVEREGVMKIVTEEVGTHFQRRSFKEFEYLRDEVDPPHWAIILSFLISVLGSLTVFIATYDQRVSND